MTKILLTDRRRKRRRKRKKSIVIKKGTQKMYRNREEKGTNLQFKKFKKSRIKYRQTERKEANIKTKIIC